MSQSIKLNDDTLIDFSAVGNDRGVLPFIKFLTNQSYTFNDGMATIPYANIGASANDAIFVQYRYTSASFEINMGFCVAKSGNNLVIYARKSDESKPPDGSVIKFNVLIVGAS